jgi:pimeloyl-ACP methyl ester carboxylesterase
LNDPSVEIREINGLRTALCVVGEGQPVLALHGWGGGIHSFYQVAEQLASRNYRIHLLDLPGFGQSDLPPETWSVADYMHFVLAYLDDCGLDQVAVVGHSFGGRISLVLAADHPARVSKMVLASSAGLRTPPSLLQMVRGSAVHMVRIALERLNMESLRAKLQERYNRRFASDDYLNAGPLRDTFVRIIEEDLTPYAQRVRTSTLLIWGDQDTETPLWQGRKLEQLIADAGLVVFEGAGHFAYQDRLSEFVHIVDYFFRNGS